MFKTITRKVFGLIVAALIHQFVKELVKPIIDEVIKLLKGLWKSK